MHVHTQFSYSAVFPSMYGQCKECPQIYTFLFTKQKNLLGLKLSLD